MEEATIGNGSQCGGSFVERGFLRWLERRLGTADFIKIAGCRSEDLPRTSLPAKLNRMVQNFIVEVKSSFSGRETNWIRLPQPLNAIEEDRSRGIKEGEIEVAP